MLAIIISSLSIMIASLIGVIFTWRILGEFIKKNIGLLVSFSAGVFLILIIGLGVEAFEEAHTFIEPLMWMIGGAIGVLTLFSFLPKFHHHHSDDHEEHTHDRIDTRKIIISDSIHNIGDGVLLAAAFSVNLSIGIAATISIFIHEIVQEMSEFFVLKQAGFSTKRALVINFLSSGTILIGAVGGFFLLEIFEAIEVPLLALSAGAFLVVVLQDLIPESVRHSHKKGNYFQHILFFLVGVLIMSSVNNLVAHSHDHGHVDSEHHNEELHDEDHHEEDEHNDHDEKDHHDE